MTILVNHEKVICGLQELSSESTQRRLWLSDGSSGEVSSFIENYLELFQGACLLEAISIGETEFGKEVDAMLTDLEQQFGVLVDEWQSEEEAIADPRMVGVRELAATTLRGILAAGSKNAARITARLVEWQSEKRQNELWLPGTDGTSAISTPRDAAWHLFLGKDYWGYLEMGARRSELTRMFLELDKLVWPLAMRGNRPSDQIIADPRMRGVRQMAARILRALERV